MFYSQFILAKKGPLGTIWIAAHLERKLRKNQVADTDIGVSVDSILFPEVPIALRLSSHLLLGVVRIYSRKVNYLFDDCSEALLKVKQAFRSTAVDLPPEESTAPYHSITLPETFDLDDFELPDNEIFQGNYVDHHVSTRDQITLQDTMEGVVYSTSQFGLDERFGDGDTSQIGLDLDEDLFVNKAAGYGNNEVSNTDYQVSVLPMEPLRMDKSDEGMTETSEAAAMIGNGIQSDDVDANTDFTAYAQAPSTPGLVEEPNLSSVQEGPACEDYLESDDRNLTDFIATENAGTASGKLYHHQGDKISSAVTMEHLACANNLGASSLTSDLAEKVKSISLVSEYLDGDISAMDGPDEVEDIQNGVVTSNEPRVNSIDQTIAGYVESVEGRLEETVGGSCPLVTEGCLENDQASRPSTHNVVEITGMEEYFSTHDSLGSNAARQLELSDRPEFENVEVQACMEPKGSNALNPVHEEMTPICGHVLQACNSNMNQPDMPSIGGYNSVVVPNLPSQDVESYSLLTSRREETLQASGASSELQGEGCDATNGMKSINEETQVSEPALHGEIQADWGKSDEQLGSAFSTDYVLGNLNGSAISDLPTPEKLLSVLEGFTDKPNDLLVESTPDKEIQNDADTSGAGTKFISGKKRSLTESVVTMQSLRTVESYGVTQSKKTAESIPDDDDLLSSILVGRRSSVLKMKPTPPAPEIASSKRLRSAPRASALKRKVLMDDTMVLHGDTIRQQLTSTEDIRRVRKKAPCTRPEISIIQRQLLEVDIFNVHVFTGMSADLVCLYSEAYDPSIIRTYEIVENNTSSEAKKDVESSVRQNVTEESGTAVTTEPGVIRNDVEAQPAETPVHIQSQNDEDHNLVCDGSNTEMQTKAVTDILELETPKNIADMEIDKGSFEFSDAENRSIIHGFEPILSTDPVSRDIHNIPADIVVDQALLDKTNGADAIQMDESCMSPAKKLDPYPTEDASIVGISNGKGSDTGDVTEHNAGSHVVETESRVRDELLLDESKGDASILIREDVHTVCAQPADNAESSLVTDRCNNLDFVNGDQAVPEIGEEKSGVVNGDENLTWESGYDDKNPASNHICSRDPDIDCSYPVELDIDMKNSSLNEGENPGWQEVYQQSNMDAEFTSGDYIAAEDGRDFENISLQNDTEFLNVDDDDVAEDDDDCGPSAEETRLHENSGWSSRTRAVAKYLQTLYDKEAVHGRKVLLVDNLLAGKTRKEASRMFFETLVLKTRDYIQVEQAIPFDNINIKPRMKLMKSDF